jgi:transaldolase
VSGGAVPVAGPGQWPNRSVQAGTRWRAGVTANPAIFAWAIEGSAVYDEQFSALIGAGISVADAYWELVIDDMGGALGLLRPVYDQSRGCDGFPYIEVEPELAHDTTASVAAARRRLAAC